MNDENLNNTNVTCPQCGAENMSNSKFCIKCGTPIGEQTTNVTNEEFGQVETQTTNNEITTENVENQQVDTLNFESNTNNMNTNVIAQENPQPTVNNTVQQPIVNNQVQQQNVTNAGNMNYFKYMLNVVLKPFDAFKKEESNLLVFKNSAILAGIVVGIVTILSLISTMITTVRVTSFFSDEVEWVWENLKHIEYFKLIGGTLLAYVGVIAAISGIYYLASIVIKKDAKFVKLFAVTVTAFIPLAVTMHVLSPLLSAIDTTVGLIISVIGIVYFVVILLELLNDTIAIENKDTRIYFHLVCLSIILLVGGFIAYKVILGSLSSGLGGLEGLGSLY